MSRLSSDKNDTKEALIQIGAFNKDIVKRPNDIKRPPTCGFFYGFLYTSITFVCCLLGCCKVGNV